MSSIMRCRSGLMALSVMRDAPVLMKVANPSSQDRTPRGAIVLAVPPAAAPYRASGLVLCGLIAHKLMRRICGFGQGGGESGIRTHGTVSRTHAFQACALSHSAISPKRPSLGGARGFLQGTPAGDAANST